jgi:medium-chain acyl-[acyl-carrier-protein] hydrolase
MELLQFEKSYKVHVYETDPNGKLNIYSVMNYMQDIASDHAEQLGYGRDDMMRDKRFWVLSRLYFEINEWPLWKDTVILKTWPNGTEGIFALRNYEIRYPDGRQLGSGSSSWLILDNITKKVQRPDGILAHFYPDLNPGYSPVRNASKLDPASEQGTISGKFNVRVSDLDVNQHTNNVGYLKWIYDTYEHGFLMKYVPQSAEINYLAESKYNDEIMIRTSSESHVFYNHSICRTSDSKELCRIRLGWKEIN